MAYVHCHSCDWEQDDFYSEKGYNPANYCRTWMPYLCGPDDIDTNFSSDPSFLDEFGQMTMREVIAREFSNYAKRILEMKWITSESWEKAIKENGGKYPLCPKCKTDNLDVD